MKDKNCKNCHFCYEYPDGNLECNNPWRNNPEIKEGGCVGFMSHKTLEECIEEATPKLSGKLIIVHGTEESFEVFTYWHDAESDDLPPIDEEVIALDKRGRISFAHRPDPNGIHGVSKITGTKYHIEAKTYGKGKWNIPDVRWWMPCPEIPKL